MGKRGPKPIPTRVLKVRGSWRGNARAGEIEFESSAPVKPRWLTGRAAKIWAEIMPLLKSFRLVVKIDRNALARYCQTQAEYEEIKSELNKMKILDRYLTISQRGGDRLNALQRALELKMKRLAKFDACFGLTIADRVGLKAERQPVNKDKKAKYFSDAN